MRTNLTKYYYRLLAREMLLLSTGAVEVIRLLTKNKSRVQRKVSRKTRNQYYPPHQVSPSDQLYCIEMETPLIIRSRRMRESPIVCWEILSSGLEITECYVYEISLSCIETATNQTPYSCGLSPFGTVMMS